MARRHGTTTLGWLLALSLGLSACGRTIEPPRPVLLRIAGSTSMQPLLQALTAAYTAQRSNVTFDLATGDSGLGLEQLKTGQIDIAASSWPPDKKDLDGAGLQATPLALDGLSVVVHPNNPVDDLSLLQVRSVFRGRIGDWREVGG